MTDRRPGIPARWCLGSAAAVWIGVTIGMGSGIGLMCAMGAILVAVTVTPRRWWVLGVLAVLGMASGLVTQAREGALESSGLPTGRFDVRLVVVEESSAASWGLAVAELSEIDALPVDAIRIAVRGMPPSVDVGATITAVANVTPGVRRVRNEPVAGTVSIERVTDITQSTHPLFVAGNAVRHAVVDRYDGSQQWHGLVSGFLIGATDQLHASDSENLRLAGLSHFVAVSGSNVALFLVLWWFATAPLSIHPRVRVLVGLVGLWLFAIITRWEASVVRASVMAAIPLVGGWFSVPVDPWMALGTAVAFLLLISGHLVREVGFQLSVFATAGVLIGITLTKGRPHRWILLPLATTLGAQALVAPTLLATFGSVPLIAPITNLLVAPLIAVTTTLAAIGVVLPVVGSLAGFGALVVLHVAEIAASGPQLGVVGVIVTAGTVALVVFRPTRPLGLAVGGILLVALLPNVPQWPSVPTLTVLDVGQGDALLIQDPMGASMLVDGGSDPKVLDQALRRHGIRSVVTVVVTHGDIDHAGGLSDLIGSGDCDELVVSAFTPDSDLVETAASSNVPVRRVRAGDWLTVGSIRAEVLSPARRYVSDNDGSIVLLLHTPVSVLLPGDIEAVAQRDLPTVHPDVLVVPHHGSATTALEWLSDVIGRTAVLSYGPNRYGHPHPDIVALLATTDAAVHRTHTEGDIVIPLVATR